MKVYEITVEYHNVLNPKLWNGLKIKRDVIDKLREISKEFIEYIDIKNLDIVDIVLTGSSANYNWTAFSDIDLHLIVDLDEAKTRCPEFTEDFFEGKKMLWNEHHDITIYDIPVEVYVQDKNERHIASGIFSIKNGRWISKPRHAPPSIDKIAVKTKANEFKQLIDQLINTNANLDDVDAMKKRLRNFRNSGLKKDGEFSVENLAFKELRKSGHLKKLRDYKREIKSEKLSLI